MYIAAVFRVVHSLNLVVDIRDSVLHKHGLFVDATYLDVTSPACVLRNRALVCPGLAQLPILLR
jgi:hypothetical protein